MRKLQHLREIIVNIQQFPLKADKGKEGNKERWTASGKWKTGHERTMGWEDAKELGKNMIIGRINGHRNVGKRNNANREKKGMTIQASNER